MHACARICARARAMQGGRHMACPREIESMWQMVKEQLRQETAATVFELWYGGIVPESYDEATRSLLFSTDSEFKLKVLNEKYKAVIEDRFVAVAGLDVNVSFRLSPAAGTTGEEAEAEREETPSPAVTGAPRVPGEGSEATARYTFENFIVGDSNRFAQAACWKVAKNPSREWNPLFIYGPSGVGKTHLLYAVINEIRRQRPAAKIIYTKGDDFTNYMIDCITHKDMSAFRERYRGCDVLLVDDIQFISGKVATQEEFFHTFQALFDEGKQIILASDRPPHEINPLEERLRSRFEQGLLADINPPNIELRVAIIKKKAEDYGIDLPGDVLSYLSENLRSNIRQIEGAIKKLVAKSMVDGRQISMELAKDCLADLLGDAEPLSVTIDKIFAAVFKKYGISREDIVGKKRTKEIARARHIAIYLVREITEMSYPNIGKLFGRDHATVMSSLDVVKKRIAGDPLFDNDIDTMKREIAGH